MARGRGAWVIYGGIHATLYPEEALEHGRAHAVVKGDGDIAWGKVVTDCLSGKPERIYEGGRIEGGQFLPALKVRASGGKRSSATRRPPESTASLPAFSTTPPPTPPNGNNFLT